MSIVARLHLPARFGRTIVPDGRVSATRQHLRGHAWLALVGILAVVLCVPFLRAVYGLEDEGILLHGAQRMLSGSRLYADLFEFYPPGGFILTIAWFDIAGVSMWSARALATAILAGIACFTYLACRQASKNSPLSASLAIAWLVMAQCVWPTQISHHWFTTLFSMMTCWVVIIDVEQSPHRLVWPLVAGASAGAAAMVTPNRGAVIVLAGMTMFMRDRTRMRLFGYVVGVALVPLVMFLYVVATHALRAAFDDVILFPVQYYTSVQGVIFGKGTSFPTVPLVCLFPVALLLALIECVHYWRGNSRDSLLFSCTAFTIAGLVGCYPRPDIVHIAFAAPLACPLFAFCAMRAAGQSRPRLLKVATIAAIVACIPAVQLVVWKAWAVSHWPVSPTPRGGVAFPAEELDVRAIAARLDALPSTDAYFFYPYMPLLPFIMARQQVSKFDILLPGYTSPAQYEDACKAVMQHAQWVVIDRDWLDPQVLKGVFPAMRDTDPEERKLFEQALESGFRLVSRDGGFELRHRAPGVGAAVCEGFRG